MDCLSRTQNRPERILFPAILVAIGFNLVMSTHFYPNLLSYQSSSVAGTEIRKKKLDVNLYAYESHSIHFSAQRFVPTWDTRELLDAEKGSLVFTNEAGYLEIEERRGASVVKKYPSQRATLLTLSFLLEWSRESELEYEYLLRLE